MKPLTVLLLVALSLSCADPAAAQRPLLDSRFAPVLAGGNTQVYAVVVEPGGKVAIGGDFRVVNGQPAQNLARLNENGGLDSSFAIGDGPDGDVRALQLASNTLYIAGNFRNYDGTRREHVARLLSNGALDTVFKPGDGPDGDVEAIAVQADGKVLIGGEFTEYAGSPCGRVARLHPNGSLDTSFAPGAGADADVRALALQADGRILVGGAFTNFSGGPCRGLVRLLTNGAVDVSFQIGSGANNSVQALLVQPDGKIVVGGEFSSFNGENYRRIVRLETNGNLDVAFHVGSAADEEIRALAQQSNGRILAAGDFTNFNGAAAARLVRLQADGTPDPTFATRADADVRALAVTAQGMVYFGGDFLAVNDQARSATARLATRTPWADAVPVGVWSYLGWFGYFSDPYYPWVYHLQHGWMYSTDPDPSSLWLYTADLGYLWTSSAVASWFYQSDRSAWLYYAADTFAPRWFYNASSGVWETH